MRVLGSARDKVAVQPLAMMQRQRGARDKAGIGLCIAGQNGQQYAVLAGERLDLIEAVGPIGCAAQEAQDDQLRFRECLLDIEIDGEIVLQLKQIGEAKRDA